MRKKLQTISAIMLAVLLLTTTLPFSVSAAESETESLGVRSGTTGECTWTLDNSGILTISGNGRMADYDSYYYESEGGLMPGSLPWGFNIKKVNIEDGVTNVGEYAFYSCRNLKSVSISNSVTSIGTRSFFKCESMSSITIGKSVSNFGCDVFFGCENLTSVKIRDIGSWCSIDFDSFFSNPLYYAHNLYLNDNLVTDLVIPVGVTHIGTKVFCGCTSITSAIVSDSVTDICENAFYNCNNLNSVRIGKSISSVRSDAFYDCSSLSSVNIKDLTAWCNISFSNNHSNPLYYAHNLFLKNELVTDLVIPDSITVIGDYAFSGCTSINSVTIPDSVTSIGSSAFSDSASLTSVSINDIVKWCNISFSNPESNPLYYAHNLYLNNEPVIDLVIPDSLTNIDSSAFYNCKSLTSVIIPESVISIGDNAFNGCTRLKSAVIPESVTVIGKEVFKNCNSVLKVYGFIESTADNYCINNSINFLPLFEYSDLGNNKLKITQCNFVDHLGNLSIPSSLGGKTVTQIGEWLFLNNSNIKSVIIPDSVTLIGKGAFYSCVELETVTMGNNVTEIGLSAFEKCIQLESINLSVKLKKIGDEAFYDCRRLKALNIPDTVTSIGEEAFTNCRSLQSLVIPNGVQTLGSESSTGFGMFENCKSLEEIVIPDSVTFIQNNAFDGCDKVTILGSNGSYAQEFARKSNLPFRAYIDEPSVGDVSMDGAITVSDVTIIQQALAEFKALTNEQIAAADVDGNGNVTVADATYLQMYLAEYDLILG